VVWPDLNEPGVLSRKSFQNLRFKLIPQMLQAPWIVQAAVGSTPCLLGQKLALRYFCEEKKYLEIDLHVGSSGIAKRIVGLCRNYSKHFICNIGIVIQGEDEIEELPESVLAVCTIKNIDFQYAIPLH
jgi:hypothetical protein